MSSEFSGEIGDLLRPERNFVEDHIKKAIENINYDINLNSWDVIIVAMEDESYDEVVKYTRIKKDMDFRLKLDYAEYVSASISERQTLIYQVLVRSLNLLQGKGLGVHALSKLKNDIGVVAESNGWV